MRNIDRTHICNIFCHKTVDTRESRWNILLKYSPFRCYENRLLTCHCKFIHNTPRTGIIIDVYHTKTPIPVTNSHFFMQIIHVPIKLFGTISSLCREILVLRKFKFQKLFFFLGTFGDNERCRIYIKDMFFPWIRLITGIRVYPIQCFFTNDIVKEDLLVIIACRHKKTQQENQANYIFCIHTS